jgi:MoxR-like ATPase
MAGLVAKFAALGAQLRGQFEERDHVIEGMLCAALAGEHVLLLGPAGTAKSALTRAFCGSVDGARHFEWLLSRFTAPEELYGPMSLSALKQDKFTRVTTGKLPEAEVVFLDEIFKSNAAVLNSLLAALNERIFHNNGTPVAIPMRMTIGASNELPEGPELAALYDRFLVRYWVDYIQAQDAFLRVVMGASQAPEERGPGLTLAEWDAARAEVGKIGFSKAAGESLFRLRTALQAETVRVSDRRWKKCVRLAQANAWLNGDTEVHDEHFAVLQHALWDQPGQRDAVREQVQRISASTVGEALRIQDTVLKLFESIPPRPAQLDKAHTDRLVAANREGNKALKQLDALADKCRTDNQRRSITDMRARVAGALEPVRAEARDAMGL